MTDIQPYIDQLISAISKTGNVIADNLKTQIKTSDELYTEAKKAGADKDYVKAEQIYKMLINDEKHPEAYNFIFSYAYVLLSTYRYEEAIDMLYRGITIAPRVPEFYTNIAYALSRMHKHEESIVYYKKALALKPDHYKSLFDMSLVKLRLGENEEGWKLHEYRNYRPAPDGFADRHVKGRIPLWDGNPESVKGKKVFVCKEQGFGDGLQFFRYLEPLANLASKVTVYCEPYLTKLFLSSNKCSNVSFIDKADDIDKIEPHDLWFYQMSMPLIVGEPESKPYLFPVADTPVPQLPPGFKVGLAWQGNPKHINDKHRSLKLSMFDHFPKDITYVSLQANIHDHSEISKSKLNIIDVTKQLIDFNDTAKFLEQLDLVISIDSAVAHLAGAVGKKCWVYVPYEGSDWRWGTLGQQTNLYHDITTYWQDRIYNYQVLDRMAADLDALHKKSI